MSFEKFLEEDMFADDFGKAPYVKNAKERQNISKVALDSGLGCKYVDVGTMYELKTSVPGVKYAGCVSMTFDAALSVYEVNSKVMLVSRFIGFSPTVQNFFEKGLSNLKNKNLEVRLIGMQSGQNIDLLSAVMTFIKKNKLQLLEIDLFGSEMRNVCFDVRTGTSFDVLVNNRLYKPGELANSITAAQFERSLKTPENELQNFKNLG